jgi:hypothetical protein
VRFRPSRAAASVAVLVAAWAAGCGGEGDIPSRQAELLVSGLDRVSESVEAGRCPQALASVASVERRLGRLSSDVDRDVRSTLDDGVDDLRQLVARDCEAPPPPAPEPTPTETTPTETETTPTETETTPTDTDTTDTDSSGSDGSGGGDDGSGGGGGGGGDGSDGDSPIPGDDGEEE